MPGPQFLMGSCAVAITAAYLGATWLRTPVGGIPAGLWAVAVAHAAGYASSLRAYKRARNAPVVLGRSPGSFPEAVGGWAALDVGAGVGRVGAALFEAGRSTSKVLGVAEERVRGLEDSVSARLDHARSRPAPLKIGVDAGPELARAILAADTADAFPVQWVAVPPGRDDQAELRRLNLDALIRQPGYAPARIVARENPGRDAGWYDWTTQRPLSFASLFPVRIDPAQITIDDVEESDPTEVKLLVALLRAAAVLSRTPSRLSLPDRLRGRRPLAASAAPAIQPALPPYDRCILDLADLLAASMDAPATPARKAAARAVSAWLATTDSWVDIAVRRRGAEAALAVVPDEPEVLLRAAAVRMAVGDDRSAMHLLMKAEGYLRSPERAQVTDHLAFLQAELEMGLPSPMTLGRVAAAICLVCATSPAEHLAYIRGDVMDDVRYSAWLVGRDQDRAVLDEVFRSLEAARRAGGEQGKMAA